MENQAVAQTPEVPLKKKKSIGKIILKIFLWLLFAAIVIVGLTVAYLWFGGSGNRNALSVVPEDAIFIIETNNLTDGWSTLNESKMWKHLMANRDFEDINSSAMSLDSLINGNETLDMLFTNRQLVISAHMISEKDYDFIFAVDLKKASKISFLKNYIKDIVGYYDYTMGTRDYQGFEIITLTDNKTAEIIQLTFIENILACSYDATLIEKSILQKDNGFWLNNPDVKKVTSEIKSNKLFNFYINFSQINSYLKCFLSEESEITHSLCTNLMFSAFNITLEDERLSFSGYLSVNDSLPSYFRALSGVSPGKIQAFEIISENAAIYAAMSFDKSEEFFSKLKEVFRAEDTTKANDYQKTIYKIEKYLKLNLDEDLFGWMGNEIAFVKLQPTANAREEDAFAIIHANDIDAAKTGLEHIMKQVKKKSLGAFKFDDTDYKNFTIKYLQYGGFIKLLFGNIFKKFDKPYFTFIDDFVVFSNTSSGLMDFIDDYLVGKTLSHNKEFLAMKEQFDARSNFFIYIQMPKIYSHLYYYSKKENRKGIKENRDLILSFTRIGFQMVSVDNMFATTLITEFNEDAAFDSELENIESAAEDLFINEMDSTVYDIELAPADLTEDGPVKLYYPDSTTIRAEGRVMDGKMSGLWRMYFESGKIMCSVNYEQGLPDGIALYYFDDSKQITRAEFTYSEGLIDGEYREFYENGTRKVLLTYKDGKPDGDAEFYYDSGIIKIEGQYEDGVKIGKWKHYTETGELIDKEKWKKGQKKGKNEGE